MPIRTLQYHVRTWGEPVPGVAPLVMVHGWMDVAASYQFVVDALSDDFMRDRFVIAPDWRGYGLTAGGSVDCYWLPDYMADLDFLLDHYAPQRPVDLIGHSMGGAVVSHYAGARPERVRRLVNMEGFVGPAYPPSMAPKRYATWMDELKQLRSGELRLKSYDSVEGVARRLIRTNPRLARDQAGLDKADWLASHWARENAEGRWEIRGDPAHKVVNAQFTHIDELMELYKCSRMPALSVEASDDSIAGFWKDRFSLAQYHARLQSMPDCRTAVIQDAGHMLHHDQPEQLARLLEGFLA